MHEQTGVISVEHGQPVESVLLFPSGGLLVSAGISFKIASPILFVSSQVFFVSVHLNCTFSFLLRQQVISGIGKQFIYWYLL